MRRGFVGPFVLAFSALVLVVGSSSAWAGGKLSLYGIRMVPYGQDAKEYSRPGWGLGLEGVLPVPQLWNILAGTAGLEGVNLLSKTKRFEDGPTGLTVYQVTDQTYWRLFIGPRIGGHGNGFVRPHAGLNLALVVYDFKVDAVVPDDYDRENEIRQNLERETRAAFGYDLNFGLDLNFSNTVAMEGGVRYVKSFSVPQQLGEGSVRVYPQYFQIYFGVGASFRMLREH